MPGSTDHVIASLRAENQRLRNILKIAHGAEPPPEQPVLTPPDPGVVTDASAPEAKLALYMRLFAARRDVYAHYWENSRKQTKGWSPVVRHPFDKATLWEKQPLPLTPEVIRAHLDRKDDLFIGLYPLLPDATTWWLAADFDGADAMLDAHAYVKAAASLSMPCALEISQSGRGAHAWTFFTAPVSAANARAMGSACLHEAMSLRGSMSLASYDRLFPNQDTVPVSASGVGNLIAAPLNGKRRYERGTTVFIDMATWEPHPDQWEYLSRLDQMTPAEVAAIARKAKIVVGPEVTRLEKSEATKIHPVPSSPVHATLGARLTIRDEDLTPALAAALRNAATIHNPQFYEAQRARRSTHDIPRFIQGFDIAVGGDLILPRGLLQQATNLVEQAGSRIQIDDERSQGEEIDIVFNGELTEPQLVAVDSMLAEQNGVLHAPTGSGKTVMACAVIAERRVSTLILLNRKVLADQWREQVKTFLGINPGQFGAGRKKTTGVVDIAMLPTLARRTETEVRELTAGYGQVVIDECHHVAAGSYEHTVTQIPAAWWLGLTATPPRRDGLEQVTAWQVGPIRHAMRDTVPQESTLTTPYEGPERILCVHKTAFTAPPGFDISQPGAITELTRLVCADEARNHQITSDIRQAMAEGRKCLVLTRRRDHLAALRDLLIDDGLHPLTMLGGTTKKELATIRERLADTKPNDPILILTTIPYGGEGFDAPVLDTVFLAGPVAFAGLLIQAVGRALRRHPNKTRVIVHDYVDDDVPIFASQHSKRRVAYRQLGFSSTEATRL
ncbi:MAG: DEAD/DEAH box helicase [Propionibacteriaceae bacterium]|jgi:superfamily II DNA or RNA helicase|nr:DEAD/DEAH box helicase [Propionibacteriaceae bacterium]